MDSTGAMWTFVRTVEQGSLSAAARALGRTPSAISKSLARLEEHLGVRLLERSTRHMRPTDAGMALYEQCRPLFDGLAEAEETVRSLQTTVAGQIRLTATPSFGRTRLAPALAAFAALHPHVTFELLVTGQRVDLVEERIDLAIREGHLVDSSLIATKLGAYRVLLCASPAYLERRGGRISAARLGEHDLLVAAAQGPDTDIRSLRLPDGRTLAATPRFMVNDLTPTTNFGGLSRITFSVSIRFNQLRLLVTNQSLFSKAPKRMPLKILSSSS
jgi:DNA-binding transcriptional LysR family regulator